MVKALLSQPGDLSASPSAHVKMEERTLCPPCAHHGMQSPHTNMPTLSCTLPFPRRLLHHYSYPLPLPAVFRLAPCLSLPTSSRGYGNFPRKETDIQWERTKAAMAGTSMQQEVCTITLSHHLKITVSSSVWSDFWSRKRQPNENGREKQQV